jgi:hypothetical protein
MISDFEFRHQLVMNLILVENDVRPAMLVQPVDYGELNGLDNTTKRILKSIKKWFPNLIHSENYKGSYEGIIISKKSHDDRTIYSNEMGEILGYPCYNDYKDIDREKEHYIVNVVVYFNDFEGFPPSINLLANACKDISLKYKYESIAEDALKFLKLNEYYGEKVNRVSVVVDENVLLENVIQKLKQNVKFEKKDKDEVLNILYNLGFSTDLQFAFSGIFEFENEYHRGIILALLMFDESFVLKPFVPINKYPEAREKHLKIISKWEQEIIKILITSNGDVRFDNDEIQKLKNSEIFSILRYDQFFDTKDKVYDGIILLLLSYVKYDCVEPFLQLKKDYPDNVNEVKKRLNIWVESISVFIMKVNDNLRGGNAMRRKIKTRLTKSTRRKVTRRKVTRRKVTRIKVTRIKVTRKKSNT